MARGQRPPVADSVPPVSKPIRLTRREVLATGAVLALAGCAPAMSARPAATATPFVLRRPATLYVDGTVPASLGDVARVRLLAAAELQSVVSAASLAAKPDLVLTFGAPPTGYAAVSVGASPVTVLTHLRIPIDGVNSAQLTGLLGGQITDWAGVDAPYSIPVHVYTLAGLPVPDGLRLASGARAFPDIASLVGAVRGQPGSIALAPVEAADWSVRNLGVEGVYPAQGRGDAAAHPLSPFTLRLAAPQSLVSAGLNLSTLASKVGNVLASATPVLDFAAAGDVMLGRGVNNQMVARGDYLFPYRSVHDEFHAADLAVANLECTITDLVPVPTDPYTFDFVSSKRAVDGLVYAGFSALTVANNHAGGAGPGTLMDMVGTLRSHSIATTGGGNMLSEARAPAMMSAKGVRVAMLGYDGIGAQCPFATDHSPGLAQVDLTALPQDIAAARARADLVIPYFHWGIEYTKDPTREQQQVARAAIDAGADMVLGVHPHWVQAIESYKGKLIIYSLGNFIFDQDWSRPTMEGMLLHMYWRGTTLASLRFVPVLDVSRCQPRPMTPAEAVGVFERMWSGTDMLASGQYGPEPE